MHIFCMTALLLIAWSVFSNFFGFIISKQCFSDKTKNQKIILHEEITIKELICFVCLDMAQVVGALMQAKLTCVSHRVKNTCSCGSVALLDIIEATQR